MKEHMYLTVARDLHRRLKDGEWAVGENLPSRRELGQEYAWVNDGTAISTAVVSDAQAQLVAQGLLETLHGAGVRVCAIPSPTSEAPMHAAFGTRPLAAVHLNAPLAAPLVLDGDESGFTVPAIYLSPTWTTFNELDLSLIDATAETHTDDQLPRDDHQLPWDAALSTVRSLIERATQPAHHAPLQSIYTIDTTADGIESNTLTVIHAYADTVDSSHPYWLRFTARIVRIMIHPATVDIPANTFHANPRRYLTDRKQPLALPHTAVTAITWLPTPRPAV